VPPIALLRALLRGAAVVVVLGLAAPSAHAQCTITGPSTLCEGSAELCGPEGPYYYTWMDSSGTMLDEQRCLSVTAPGTYQLITFDFINGLLAGPCTHVIGASGTSSCIIEGPTSACDGASVELCGQDGASEYKWGGPGGFTASTRCVQVNVAGTYWVQVRNDPTGCWTAPCEKALAMAPCRTRENCPVAPWLWHNQCASDHWNRHRLFDHEQMALIGKGVDEHAISLAWEDPVEGFCRTLKNRSSLRARALRQLAGVMANACLYELGIEPQRGPERGIDPATDLELEGFSGTVADWIASADERLFQLGPSLARDRTAKEAYRAIIRAGWQINHGQGIGPVCSVREGALVLEADASPEGEFATDGSLDDELRDPDQLIAFESLEPNPAPGSARITYVISAAAAGEVSLRVYDVTGRLVRELVRGELAPGRHMEVWDGRDGDGKVMRNGMYFVMGRVGGQKVEGRLILLR